MHLFHFLSGKKEQNALTFDTSQTFAIISAVSAACFKSEEYMAAGLASFDADEPPYKFHQIFYKKGANSRHGTANNSQF
jgi:hypothetical protein